MNIVSQIKVNDKWVTQNQLPTEIKKQILCQAMKPIGFSFDKQIAKEKTA